MDGLEPRPVLFAVPGPTSACASVSQPVACGPPFQPSGPYHQCQLERLSTMVYRI